MTFNTRPVCCFEDSFDENMHYSASMADADVIHEPEIYSDSNHLTKRIYSNICQAKPGEIRFFQFCFTNCTQGV